VDIKVTSIRQPQSSCPFKSARQKIYGLGYSLIVFVYDKKDDPATKTWQACHPTHHLCPEGTNSGFSDDLGSSPPD